MNGFDPNIQYLLAVVAIAALTLVARSLVGAPIINRRQNRVGARLGAPFDAPNQQELRPAELAYLLHQGDMANVMVVLVFDLLHRAVKGAAPGTNLLELAPYEISLWAKIKDYVSRMAQDQAGKILPDPSKESLEKVFRKFFSLYQFFMVTLREFLGQIISDPKRLKRYFSFAGTIRLVADLGSAGYQQVVNTELSDYLTERGLLMSVSQREGQSRQLLIISLTALVILLVLLLMTWSDYGIAFMVIASVISLSLRLLWSLTGFLPYYSEFNEILRHIKRPGWRLPLIRLVVNSIGAIVFGVMLVASVVCLTLGVAVLCWCFSLNVVSTIEYLLPLTCALLVVVDTVVLSHRIRWHAQASASAQELLRQYRHRLAEVSPLDAFKELLLTPEYSPLFSELIAVYGIETLWLLA